MPLDREATLRKAEKFLRAGRLDAAIAEYAGVLEDHPADLTTANTLGDLCVRAGQQDRAVALYRRVATHQLKEGFYPKAAALLKKIVRLRPDDEEAIVQLGDIAVRQGLIGEARTHYSTVAARRGARGDEVGAADVAARLAAAESARVAAAEAARRQTPVAVADPAPSEPPADAVDVVAADPDDPVVAAILGMTFEPPAAAAATAPVEPVPPARDLEDVFAGLRAEAANDPAEDQTEDYFSLARTFVEMGQHDEAIEALHTAVKSPRNRFSCASLLARLYRDAGDIPHAIEWYERAAEAPAARPEDGHQTMYDLADLLETMGESARALAVFIEIDSEAPDFLDVRARIGQLSGDRAGG